MPMADLVGRGPTVDCSHWYGYGGVKYMWKSGVSSWSSVLSARHPSYETAVDRPSLLIEAHAAPLDGWPCMIPSQSLNPEDCARG